MKLTGSRKYYTPPPPKLPPGLVELMEGLTKEVLKHNPSDVYSFCASHMEQLLEKRDGPSRKKLLSLEDKIKRVQEKVRQRAEKRKQGHDTTLIQNQSNNTVNTDLKFNVPKLITAQESPIPTISDINNTTLMHDEVIQNIVKAPIRHEHALENLSEMEISHESDSNIATLIQNVNKNYDVLKTDHDDLSNQNDIVIKAVVIDDLVHHGNKANENQIKTESSTIITPDAETVHEHIVNLDSKKTTGIIASDIVPETSIVIEQSNKRINGDTPFKDIDVEMNQKVPRPADKNKLTVDSNENLSKAVESSKKISRDTKDVPVVVHKNNFAMVVEDHNNKSSEKEYTDAISMSDSLNGIDEPIDKKGVPILRHKVAEIPCPVNLQVTNKIEQTSDKIEQMQQTNNTNKNITAENIQLSPHTKKVELSSDIIESTNKNNTVTQELGTKNDNSQTKNNEDLKPSNNITESTNEDNSATVRQELGTKNDNPQTKNNEDLKPSNNITESTNEDNSATVRQELGTKNDNPQTKNNENLKPSNNIIESTNEDNSATVRQELGTKNDNPQTKINEDLKPSNNITESTNEDKSATVRQELGTKNDNPQTKYNEDLKPSNNITESTNEDKSATVRQELGTKNDNPQTKNDEDLKPSNNITESTNEDNSATVRQELGTKNDNSQIKNNEDLKPSNNITESTNEVNNATVRQKMCTKNDNLQTKNNEDLKSSNRTTVEKSNNIEISPLPNMEILNNKEENLEVKQINSVNQEVKKETTSILKSEPHFGLPSPNIDSDILTLITENTVIEAHHAFELNNDNPQIVEIDATANKSPAENKPVIVDKEISKSDDLPRMDDNSSHAIENKAGNSDISKSETLTNVPSEKTQNDNHDSNMDLETAAVTIQKVFRNFLFKSRGSTFEDTVNDETHFKDEDGKNKEDCDFPIASALNIDRRAHGITRMDTVLQTVNEEKSLSLSDDSSTLSSAATIIQAHVRGFLVRNKFNSNKTVSTNSLAPSNSNEPSITSIEAINDQYKNKTVLNIHIVPGGESCLSRDESLITSMELSLDSPPSSINLHPLGYDKSERRKQLKREDAIQSISPPSNNSGKLSEDFDSAKEIPLIAVAEQKVDKEDVNKENGSKKSVENGSFETDTKTNKENENNIRSVLDNTESHLQSNMTSFIDMNSDEIDVVTPFEESVLLHSGEFHDAVLPTRVSRSDTSVVSEFKNVLVYFLLWNHT